MSEQVLAVRVKHWSPGVSMLDFHMPSTCLMAGLGAGRQAPRCAFREIEREIGRSLAHIILSIEA